MSYGDIAQRTGIRINKVYLAIKRLTDELLLKKGVVGTTARFGSSYKTTFTFQKDYHRWAKKLTTPRKGISPKVGSSATPKAGSSLIDVKEKEKKEAPRPSASPPSAKVNGDTPAFMQPVGQELTVVPDLVQAFLKKTAGQPRPREVISLPEKTRNILLVFKAVQGFDLNDEKWNLVYFKKLANDAEDLLDVFGGDLKMAAMCLSEIAGEFRGKGYSFTLATIVKHAAEWKYKNAPKDPQASR